MAMVDTTRQGKTGQDIARLTHPQSVSNEVHMLRPPRYEWLFHHLSSRRKDLVVITTQATTQQVRGGTAYHSTRCIARDVCIRRGSNAPWED